MYLKWTKAPLPDTLEQNTLPLVKNMIKSSSKFNFDKEQKHAYPVPPDEVLDLFDAVRTNYILSWYGTW